MITKEEPKQQITQLRDKCVVCSKILKVKSTANFISNKVRYKRIEYECGHFTIKRSDSQTLFETFITAAHRHNDCQHNWNKNLCISCGANRPFNFQVEGMRALEVANGRLAIFDEMGLGKTIQSLGYIYFKPESLPVLYIVKSGIKYQWLQAITTWLGPEYFAQVLTSSKESFLPGLKSYIVSYDILRRLDTDKLKSLIEKIGIKTLVLDECQQIKNPDSSRTQEVRKLAKQIPNIIPLSGTPWKNRGSEFFVVLNMLDPQRFWSFEGFKRQWVDYYYDGPKLKEGGIRNPARFKEYIKDLAIRRERTEVMPELPLINRTKLISEVPESARIAYNNAQDNLIKEYNEAVIGGEEDTFETKQKLMQNLIIMRQIVGLAKVPATVEFAQEFLEETERKLVIFVHHIECGKMILKQMSEWCAENDIAQPLALSGGMSSEERYSTQTKFNDSNARLLVASTLASGEGLNLQSCSDCVMHERQWNPANEMQAEGRFIRIGQQSQSVTATYVHGKDTIDTQLDAIVEKKRIQFDNVMNKNGAAPAWNEAGLLKELVQSIINSRRR